MRRTVRSKGESSPLGYFTAFSFKNEIFLKNQCLWLCVLSFPFVFLSMFDGMAIWMDGTKGACHWVLSDVIFSSCTHMFKPIKV